MMATKPESTADLKYTVYGNGAVKVNLSYDPVKDLADMPEFGILIRMDADFDRIRWYGNGPEECYVDRQRGARLGAFEGLVKDQMSEYMVPQECGNHTDVRFAKVVNEKGRGLMLAVPSGEGMSFSALPYSPHELENATHPNELPPVHYTYVRAAKAQMGIGGDDSWGAKPHPQFLLPDSGNIKFEFFFLRDNLCKLILHFYFILFN